MTFAHGAMFERSARQFSETAKDFGFEHEVFGPRDLRDIFEKETLERLSRSGSAKAAANLHFAWKPTLLQKIAKESEENEVIGYFDSSRYDDRGWATDPKELFDIVESRQNEIDFLIGPHFSEFTLGSFSSTSASECRKLMSSIGINHLSSDWRKTPQALASLVVFRNNQKAKDILKDWTNLALDTDFFVRNLRADQAAINLLSYRHKIFSYCLTSSPESFEFEDTNPHPPWAKTPNFYATVLSDKRWNEGNFHPVSSCDFFGTRPSRRFRTKTFLRKVLLAATYKKNSMPVLSDVYDLFAGRISLSRLLRHYKLCQKGPLWAKGDLAHEIYSDFREGG